MDLATTNVKLSVLGQKLENLTTDSDTTQFELGKLTAQANDDNKTITLIIPLKRLYHYHIASTFFPTASLLIISCLTLFIDPERFEAKIGLSLTTMLVMQTLQENIGDNLPKTAYIKLIDEWLIFGMCVPFAVFLVLVFIEIMPDENQIKILDQSNSVRVAKMKSDSQKRFTKERIHKLFQWVIPFLTTLSALGYWIRVTYQTYNQDKEYFS